MSHILELPTYLEQEDAVRDRFSRLKQRPIALEVKNLGKSFESPTGEVVALKDINFKTHKREFVCVIGPSGCGKSTFLRCLNRMNDTIDGCRVTGEIKLDKTDIYDPAIDVVPLRGQVGMVFQTRGDCFGERFL